MSRKPSLLATAINSSTDLSTSGVTGTSPPSRVLDPEQSEEGVTTQTGTRSRNVGYVPPSRANKSAKTHYLRPEFWTTLEELSFRTRDGQGKRIPQERLVGEALNLLFAKYNYPIVRESEE